MAMAFPFSHSRTVFSGGKIDSQTAQQDPLNWSSLYGILIEYSNKRLAYKRVGYFKAMRLAAGEALEILKAAEVQNIRLY